jgi:hypothetical protein
MVSDVGQRVAASLSAGRFAVLTGAPAGQGSHPGGAADGERGP